MNHTTKVGWSKSSAAITIIVTMIVIAALCSCLIDKPIFSSKILIISLLIICLLVIGSLVPFKIELTNDEVLIHRFIGIKHILITNILDCGLSYTPVSIKICGSGGFCGCIGWYKAPDLGIYFSYVLNKDQTLYLILNDGRKYMLSCDAPDTLITKIKDLKKDKNLPS